MNLETISEASHVSYQSIRSGLNPKISNQEVLRILQQYQSPFILRSSDFFSHLLLGITYYTPLISEMDRLTTLQPESEHDTSYYDNYFFLLPYDIQLKLLSKTSKLALCLLCEEIKKDEHTPVEVKEVWSYDPELKNFLLKPEENLSLNIDLFLEVLSQEPTLFRIILCSVDRELLNDSRVKDSILRCLKLIKEWPNDPDVFIKLLDSSITIEFGNSGIKLSVLDAIRSQYVLQRVDLNFPQDLSIKINDEDEKIIARAFRFLTNGITVADGLTPPQLFNLFQASEKYKISELTEELKELLIKNLDKFHENPTFAEVCDAIFSKNQPLTYRAEKKLKKCLLNFSSKNQQKKLTELFKFTIPLELLRNSTFNETIFNHSMAEETHLFLKKTIQTRVT